MATANNSNLHQRLQSPSANGSHPLTSSWEPQTTHADELDDDELDAADFPNTNGHANGHAHIHPTRRTFPPRSSSLAATPGSPTTIASPPSASTGTNIDEGDSDNKKLIQASLDPKRSPFALALRASLLSFTLGISLSLVAYLTLIRQPSSPLWRLPLFGYLLCQFHVLEYHVTALYNPGAATTAAFLLDNGRAYTVAHVCAFIECFVHWAFFPSPSSSEGTTTTTTTMPKLLMRPLLHPFPPSPSYILLGFFLLTLGQTVRTLAMARAGTNFTRLVASHRRRGHFLVTDGVYTYLRHPSYFGFFWWGIGGQMVLGNTWCLLGYAVVLWRFFRARIEKEEMLLVGFFGDEYVRYRDRTWVGIPFI